MDDDSPIRAAIKYADKTGEPWRMIEVFLDRNIPLSDKDRRDLANWAYRILNPDKKRRPPPLYEHETRIAAKKYFDSLSGDRSLTPEDSAAAKEERIRLCAEKFGLPESEMRNVAKSQLGSFTNYRAGFDWESYFSPTISKNDSGSSKCAHVSPKNRS